MSAIMQWMKEETWAITCRTAVEKEHECTETHTQRRNDGWRSHGNGNRRCWKKRWVGPAVAGRSFSLSWHSHRSITPILYSLRFHYDMKSLPVLKKTKTNVKAGEAGPEAVTCTKGLFYMRAMLTTQCITFSVSVPHSLFSIYAHIKTLTDSHILSHSKANSLANVSIWLKK